MLSITARTMWRRSWLAVRLRNTEHATVDRDDTGLSKLAVMTDQALLLADELDRVAADVWASGRLGDE
ncbi:hypothetical protein H7I76_00965, partial [Mycolicibacterium vaccae]|nr:hypothetical protein [Mycolicibacterium vaccae]